MVEAGFRDVLMGEVGCIVQAVGLLFCLLFVSRRPGLVSPLTIGIQNALLNSFWRSVVRPEMNATRFVWSLKARLASRVEDNECFN